MIASPWGPGHLRRRDWEVLATLFRFRSVEEIQEFARQQQEKADKAAEEKERTA